jgi:hypothetical protein
MIRGEVAIVEDWENSKTDEDKVESVPSRTWPHGVEARRSLIVKGGEGLFATREFGASEVLGEYHGRVLNLAQAMRLENRDYLMGGFGFNAHVDARFTLASAARYVNDNFDASALNAHFVKDKVAKRAKLVATRSIHCGEEVITLLILLALPILTVLLSLLTPINLPIQLTLTTLPTSQIYASYGESYWSTRR